jgi:hypothetical protein
MPWRRIAVLATRMLVAVIGFGSLTCTPEVWTERVERDLAERLRGCGAGYQPAAHPDACVVELQSTDNPCATAGRATRAEAGSRRCGSSLLLWERGPYDGHDCFFDTQSGLLVGWARWTDSHQFCGLKSTRVVAGQFPSGWR